MSLRIGHPSFRQYLAPLVRLRTVLEDDRPKMREHSHCADFLAGSAAHAGLSVQRLLPPALTPFITAFTGNGNDGSGAINMYDNLDCRDLKASDLTEDFPYEEGVALLPKQIQGAGLLWQGQEVGELGYVK